jgi:hypothetical protein
MDGALQYLMEVFVDDFIAIAMPKTTVHLDHLANAMMHKIYDVFPPSAMTIDDDPISNKKMEKGKSAWANVKDPWHDI